MIPKEKEEYIELVGTVNNYTVYKRMLLERASTRNFFFYVYETHNPRRQLDLLLLKAYVDKQGYTIQKSVLQNSQFHTKIFIESCDSYINRGQEISYVIEHNMPHRSLLDFLSLIKTMSLTASKFFFKEILLQLKYVQDILSVKQQKLYISDIIVDKEIKPVVMGWSKTKNPATQKEILFDCAQILFTLISGVPFPSKTKKSTRNYPNKKQWELIVKTLEKKKCSNQLLKNLIQLCIIEEKQCSIQRILSHPFLQQQINQSEIMQEIKELHMKKSSQKKEKEIQKFNRNTSRSQIVEQFQRSVPSQQRDINSEFVDSYNEYNESLIRCMDEVQMEDMDLSCRKSESVESSENGVVLNKAAFLVACLHSFLEQNLEKSLIFEEGYGILKGKSIDFSPGTQNKKIIIQLTLDFEIKETSSFEKQTIKIKLLKNQLQDIQLIDSRLHYFYQKNLINLLEEEIRIALS